MSDEVTRYFYLIEESNSEKYPEGRVMMQEKMMQNHRALDGGRHSTFEASMLNIESGDRCAPTFVYLGSHTFESEDDCADNALDVAKELAEEYKSDSGGSDD